MDPVAAAFIGVLSIEAIVIAGLVGYLLFRPSDKKKKPKLQPEEKVATDYGEPINENGHALIDVKEQPRDTVSTASSTSSDFKKPLELDSISIEIEKPFYNDPPPTVIQMDREPAPEGDFDAPLYRPEDKADISSSTPTEKANTPIVSDKDESSSSSSSEEERSIVEEPINESVALVSQQELEKPTSSSSSSSGDEKHVVGEPAIVPVNARSNEEGKEDPLLLLSKDEDDKPTVEKTSSSTSGDDDKDMNKVSSSSLYPSLNVPQEEDKKTIISSSEDEKLPIDKPMVHVVHQTDDEEQEKRLSSSSSENKDTLTASQRPVPVKRTTLVKESFKQESVSSSTTSSDESDLNTKITKVKKKKIKRLPSTSSSSDEQIINHKKKTHRKRYIHNIEEVEIIEEHTFNKTHKTIYKKAPPGQERPEASSESDKEEAPPAVYVSKVRKVKRRSKKIPPSSSSSSSSENEAASPDKDMKYHTEYRFDVTKNKDDDEKHVTTNTFFTSSSSPTKQVTKHRTYTETIQEDKTKKLEMCMSGSHSSESDSETRMRSEKRIPISSSARFQPITTTLTVEKKKQDLEISKSESHSSESDTETRMRSEKLIPISSSPRFQQIAQTFTLEEKKQELEMCMSGSHSSENDSETRMRSEKSISISSSARFQPVTTTLTVEKKKQDLEISKSESHSSESDTETRMRSEKLIPISSSPRFQQIAQTFTLEEKKQETEEQSSSSSSESDSETRRMRSETNISLTTPLNEKVTETVVVDQLHSPELKSSSSSSESDDDVRMSSSAQIQLKSPPKREVFTATVVTNENTAAIISSSESSSDEKEQELPISKEVLTPSSSSSSSSSSDEEVTTTSDLQTTKVSTVIKDYQESIEDVEENVSKTTVNTENIEFKERIAVDENVTRTTYTLETDVREPLDLDQNVSTTSMITEVDFGKAAMGDEDRSKTTITNEEIVVTTTTSREKKKKLRKDFQFTSGWKRQVSLADLFEAGVVSKTTVEQLEEGTIEQEEVEKSIRVYLVGEEPIAGLIMSDTGEKVSIYDAWKKGLIRRGTSISLLEAQAATGRIINPRTAEKMSVNEATNKRLIDRQFEAVLVRAERAVYGYKTRLSNETLSLFEAMKRGLVVENHGVRLLEAQIATGGIVDPNANHRLPVEIAYQRGLFDQRLNDILEDPSDDTRGFFDPITEENLTYLELMERCVIDKDTGLRLLPFRTHRKQQRKVSKVVFESATKRQVLLQDIVNAGLLDNATASKFDNGRMTEEEVKDMVAQIKVYVDGKLPIAGIINSQTGEKMSFLEACRSGLIRKGTAFELLEAQAACGKIMDVQTGKPVSIETALRSGVIDSEFEDVVTRASRAVTGYREPFKREVLSLCEAMIRRLVVDRHAIRLLEAQIATGGIVDMKSPVRLKVKVAMKRGLLDKSLAQKLEKHETASYFDPVTGENLNYSELMGRCVLDKDTNLLFLMLEGGTVTENIRPFEPEPETMKIREKSHTTLSTEVVQTKKKKKKRSSKKESLSSPPPDSVPSSPPAILSRRVVIVDPTTGKELTVKEALEHKLIDKDTAKQLMAQEGDFDDNEEHP